MEKIFTIEEIEKVLEMVADENHFEWKFYFLPVIRNKFRQYVSCEKALKNEK